MKKSYSILLGCLAAALIQKPLSVVKAASDPTPLRIYKGRGTITATATTDFGNRGTATCTQYPEVTATFYAKGYVHLSFNPRPAFVASHDLYSNDFLYRNQFDPKGRFGSKHGDIQCGAEAERRMEANFPYADNRVYVRRVEPEWHQVDLTYSARNLVGTWEFEIDEMAGTISTPNIDTTRVNYSGRGTLTLNIPVIWNAKSSTVSGIVQDWDGNPFVYPIRSFDYTGCFGTPCESPLVSRLFTDAQGRFTITTRGPGPYVQLVTPVYSDTYNPFSLRVNPPANDVVITLIPKKDQSFSQLLMGSRVEYRDPNSLEWKAAEDGMIPQPGMNFRTLTGGTATFLIKDKGIVNMTELSEFHITEEFKPKSFIDLVKGMLVIKVTKNNDFELKTSAGVAGGGIAGPSPRWSVAGTRFTIEADSSGSTVKVFDGIVEAILPADPDSPVRVYGMEKASITGAETVKQVLSTSEQEELKVSFSDPNFGLIPDAEYTFDGAASSDWSSESAESWSFTEGEYVLHGASDGGAYSTAYVEELSNFSAQVDVEQKSGGSSAAYGLRFRSDDTGLNHFEFAISSEGSYSLWRTLSGISSPLVDWTPSSALRTGPDVSNTLLALVEGSSLSLYANETFLTEIEDALLPRGKLGFFAIDSESANDPITVAFDNLLISESPSTGDRIPPAEPPVSEPPTISAIPNQSFNAGTKPESIHFTAGDLETHSSGLAVIGHSSNSDLIPSGNMEFSTNGTDWTVNINPVPAQTGSTIITIRVTDGDGMWTESSFVLTAESTNEPISPTLIYFEDFESTQEGQLPAGWIQINHTTQLNSGFDFNDPESEAYEGWTVIDRNRLNGDPFSDRRLDVAPDQTRFGEPVTSLANGNIVYAESDNRNGDQVQYLHTPNYDFQGVSEVTLIYNSIYEQNQDSLGAVEYSLDQGATWLPVIYMIDERDILYNSNDQVDAVATLNEHHSDVAIYTDQQGQEIGGSYGAFIGAPITSTLAPYISGRINDDSEESKRVEQFRLEPADGQRTVQFRFLQAGTDSWYFGIDEFAIYGVTGTGQEEPPTLQVTAATTGNIVLTFQGLLHSASDVTGPFTEVPQATSPLTITPTSTSQFYKAVRP